MWYTITRKTEFDYRRGKWKVGDYLNAELGITATGHSWGQKFARHKLQVYLPLFKFLHFEKKHLEDMLNDLRIY